MPTTFFEIQDWHIKNRLLAELGIKLNTRSTV